MPAGVWVKPAVLESDLCKEPEEENAGTLLSGEAEPFLSREARPWATGGDVRG